MVKLRHLICTFFAGLLIVSAGAIAEDKPFGMPPEWTKQEAVWIGWPVFDYPTDFVGGTMQRPLADLRVKMIREIHSSSRVALLVASNTAENQAREYLRSAKIDLTKVDFVYAPFDDYFVRDVGPRFLSNGNRLKIADIPWNCYGTGEAVGGSYFEECLAREANDGTVAKTMALETINGKTVSEGGGLESTSTLLMGYLDTALQRNPGMSKEEIEADYLKVYGKEKMIWLKKSPISDVPGYKIGRFFGWGANGHVDEFARFVNETTVVIGQIDEERINDPLARADYETLKSNLADLKAARSVEGEPLTIIEMPVPDIALFAREFRLGDAPFPPSWKTLTDRFTDDDQILYVPAASYLNFVITNDKILVPQYWEQGMPDFVRDDDQRAVKTLESVFPGRTVVGINPLALNFFGGGMHCATQQQPAVTTE